MIYALRWSIPELGTYSHREIPMKENNTKVLGWGAIIAIMAVVAVVTGVLLGLMNKLFGLSQRWMPGGIGASVGAVGVHLIARRRAALERQKNG